MDAEMFLDEYPLWKVGGPPHAIILQGMFVHATESGQKEAERLICQGCLQGFLRLNPEADVPAIQLIGYWTSQKEIQYLLDEVYMLKRPPSLPPCGPKQMEKATRDILSSLGSYLQRRGGTVKMEEDQRGAAAATPQPSCHTESHSQTPGREYSHNEALQEAREAHRWALEAVCMLELNVERLNKEADGAKCQCHCSHSCPGGRSPERCVRSPNQHRPETCDLSQA